MMRLGRARRARPTGATLAYFNGLSARVLPNGRVRERHARGVHCAGVGKAVMVAGMPHLFPFALTIMRSADCSVPRRGVTVRNVGYPPWVL
jgi:hypothetical protein